jgi:tetratricopeptide (TPR) repeat protein
MARADIYQSKGDTGGAVADYDAVLAKQPKNANVLQARAAALMQAKSYAKAAENYDRLIALEPKNARAVYQRGLAYEQAGERDKAMNDYRLALSRDRRMGDAKKALDRLAAVEREERIEAARQRKLARKAPAAAAAPHQEAAVPQPQARPELKPEPKTAPKVEAKPLAKLEAKPEAKPAAPVVEAKKPVAVEASREDPTGSIDRKEPPARQTVVHARPVHVPPPQTAKSRAREERIAAREREQRRLRIEFEKAQRVAEMRGVERRRAPQRPVVRYYRAGSRDTTFSDVWR